jgi:TusA-related sulfurtransferase
MKTTVDARGLSCPQPVLMMQKAVAGGKFPIEVSVDTVTARENVRRAAEYLGCAVKVAQQDDEFTLTLTKR